MAWNLCLSSTIHVKRIAFQKHLLILPLLEDIVFWVLFKLGTTWFIKANFSKTLSSSARTLFFSGNPVMWCKSVRLVHKWDSERLLDCYLFPMGSYWLSCRHKQTIDYIIVQTPDRFPQSFTSRTGWNSQTFWTLNTQKLCILQVFQSFSQKCKSLFLHSCPKRAYQVPVGMYIKTSQKKTTKHK